MAIIDSEIFYIETKSLTNSRTDIPVSLFLFTNEFEISDENAINQAKPDDRQSIKEYQAGRDNS